jgi:hypothetical protein
MSQKWVKVQRPVSSASFSGLCVILEAAFTIALLGVLLYNSTCHPKRKTFHKAKKNFN